MNFSAKEYLKNRIEWHSELGFIMVTAGATIGVGNFWILPSLVSHYGINFFIPYLLALLTIAIPTFAGAMIIGRHARQNQVSALFTVALESGRSLKWKWLGWFGALALLLMLGFYTLVTAMPLAYFSRALTGNFDHFQQFLQHPMQLLGWTTLLILMASAIIGRGIRHGLELISYITVALIFVILFALIIITAQHHLFKAGLLNLLSANAHVFTWAGLLAAISYAFFSLSIGGGTMLVYGSYLPQRASLLRAIIWIVILEIASSLFACIALAPWLLTHTISIQHEFSVLFNAVPNTIEHLKHNALFGSLFYLMLFLAGLTSLIAMMEPLATLMIERFYLSRIKATMILALMIWLLNLGSVYSFQLLAHFQWDYFNAISIIAGDFMLPIGGLGLCLFAGHVMIKEASQAELNYNKHPVIYNCWRFLARWIAPIGIIFILIGHTMRLF